MRALNKRKNRNVAFYLLNKRGFTLIEMLLSLSLFSLILIYFIHTVPLLTYHAYSDEIIEQMEWEIFLNQAKRELFSSKNISISDNKILFEQQDQIISYQIYQDMLRRQVDGKGHEILLFKIQSFQITQINNGISISIVHNNGKTYQEEIFLPKEIPIFVLE